MKYIIIKTCILGCLSIIFLSLSSGDNNNFIDDYKVIASVYSRHTKSKIEMKYELYSDFTGSTLVTSTDGFTERDHLNYYSNAFDKEILQTSDYIINTDLKKKLMFINEIPVNYVLKKENGMISGNMTEIIKAIDSFSTKLKEIKYLGVKDNIKSYKLVLPESRFQALDISFDINSHIIKKITIYPAKISPSANYKGKSLPRVEISYPVTDFNPEFQKNEFSISKYVKQEGNKFIPVGKYKGYKIIHKKFTEK
jgi:hypothetical protein